MSTFGPEVPPTDAEIELTRMFRATDAMSWAWQAEGTDDPRIKLDGLSRLDETIAHMDAEGLAHLRHTVLALAEKLGVQLHTIT